MNIAHYCPLLPTHPVCIYVHPSIRVGSQPLGSCLGFEEAVRKELRLNCCPPEVQKIPDRRTSAMDSAPVLMPSLFGALLDLPRLLGPGSSLHSLHALDHEAGELQLDQHCLLPSPLRRPQIYSILQPPPFRREKW